MKNLLTIEEVKELKIGDAVRVQIEKGSIFNSVVVVDVNEKAILVEDAPYGRMWLPYENYKITWNACKSERNISEKRCVYDVNGKCSNQDAEAIDCPSMTYSKDEPQENCDWFKPLSKKSVLSVQDIKFTPLGDWLWIIDEDWQQGRYREVIGTSDYLCCSSASNGRKAYSYTDYGKTWIAYKNKELAEHGELTFEQVNTLKLLTCASICYALIEEQIKGRMPQSKEMADLFMRMTRVQGTTNSFALSSLAKSNLNCDKITCFDDVLETMPQFKEYLQRVKQRKK